MPALPASAPVEERLFVSGKAVDQHGGSHSRSKGGPSLVEIKSSDMEWSMLDPTLNGNGCVHGCIGHGLGHCDQELLMVRIIVDASALSTYQCQGATHSLHGNRSPGVQGQDLEHHMQQHIDHHIHQSLWWYLIT